jgi:predicted permease
MFRSFQALRSVDPGFDPEGVMTARLTVPAAEIQGWAEVDGFYRQLEDRLLGVPGVTGVGYVQGAPLVTGGAGYFSIESEDHPRGPDELPLFANNNALSPGYLEAMGIAVLEGRTPQEGDGADGARAIVVNRTFAEMWWPGESPLGHRMRLGYAGEEWHTIVGVVEDAHYADLQTDPQEMVYWPLVQGPAEAPQAIRGVDVVVKTVRDPLELVPILRREVQALNPRIPVSNPTTMRQAFEGATARTSFTMALLGSASGTALLLGLVGIYGVISYIVSQRTREIGVRLALGASGGTVRGMIVKQGLVLATAGVVVGVLAALGLSTVMASLLYGVSATDPLTYVVLALALVGTATAASWIPAHRASRVDPAQALRAE